MTGECIVVQGGADTSFSRFAIFAEGLVTCACCGEVVEGSIWDHLSYFCRVTLENPDLIDEEVIMRGQAELRVDSRSSLWLRGLRPLDMVDPLGSEYVFTNSWGNTRLDVDGCLLGSDGTGGENNRVSLDPTAQVARTIATRASSAAASVQQFST